MVRAPLEPVHWVVVPVAVVDAPEINDLALTFHTTECAEASVPAARHTTLTDKEEPAAMSVGKPKWFSTP